MLNGAQRNAVEWSGVKHLTLVKRRFFASARPSLRSGPAPAQNDGVFAQVTQKVGMPPRVARPVRCVAWRCNLCYTCTASGYAAGFRPNYPPAGD